MAIQWGEYQYPSGSSAGFRVGIEVTNTAVTTSSSSVTFTFKVYVQNSRNVNDWQWLTFGGTAGSHSQVDFNNVSETYGYYALRATKTYTYTYSTYGTSPGTKTFSATLGGTYNGVTPSKSVTITIPARPFAGPAAPSSVAMVRNSDNQATISWTRNATVQAPYTGVAIQRKAFPDGAWVDVATASSSATSYVDNAIDINNAYQYQVRAVNSVGTSGWVAANAAVGGAYLHTTPAAPSNVVSTLNTSGTTITTSWQNNHYPSTNNTLTIQRSVNGGAYANVVTGLGYTTTSWTDPTPGAGTNRYRIAAVQSYGSLVSPYIEGNTVSTQVPPLAPTNLLASSQAPGAGVDATKPITFTWQHNPGGDGAAQTSFELQTSTNAGSTWTTRATVTSSDQSWTMPANTLTNNQTVYARVRTRGVTAAGYGPYSSSLIFTTRNDPVTTVTGPPTTVTTLPMTATWTYSQAQSLAQNAWELELLDGATVVESRSGTTGTSVQLSHRPLNGTRTLRVRTRSSANQWSAWATRTLTINLLPPAAPIVEGGFQPETGSVVLHLTAETPVGGSTLAVASLQVERRVPGGDWVLLATGIPVDADVVDPLPISFGDNEYRVTSVSATPSYNQVTETITARGEGEWVYLNYGPAFSKLLRTRSRPEISAKSGREKGTQRFLGRPKPTPIRGEGRRYELQVGANLVTEQAGMYEGFPYDSPPADWEYAGREAEVVALRDFTGRRIFGELSDVGTAEISRGLSSVGFSVEETEYVERYG